MSVFKGPSISSCNEKHSPEWSGIRFDKSCQIPSNLSLRGDQKKSGLASAAVTRVLEQLDQNGQFLRNPYNICINWYLVAFCSLTIEGDMDTKVKKWTLTKWVYLSIL